MNFDNFVVNVYFTPGHTCDCVCLKIGDNLFSGDTLFANGVGRTDLYDSSDEKMQKSLKLIKNIDYINLYPAHFEITTKNVADKIIDYYIEKTL